MPKKKIMELRERSIELQEENFQLRDELRELKGKLAERESLTFIGQVYYSGNAENRDGSFCQKCHDSESKLVRLHPFEHYVAGSQWQCKVCKSDFVRENA